MRSKNHFVSKNYLKNWCNSDGHLWCYRTLVSHNNVRLWKDFSPGAVAYHLHLYSQLKDHYLDDEIEEWFDKDFESPAQNALNRAITDSRLSSDDWIKLIRFVALHDVRTPARLVEHLERAENIFSEVLIKLQNDLPKRLLEKKKEHCQYTNNKNHLPLKITLTQDEDKEKERAMNIKVESYVGRSSWLFSLKHILNNTINILTKHKWTIIRPYDGMKWFTSDNPVIKLNFINQVQYDLKGGWGVKRGNILFPLDPEHLLFTEIGSYPPIKGTRFNKEKTLFIRKVIAENSYRMIFSKEPDREIESYIPRVVDKELSMQEEEMWEKWHEKNAMMEAEFVRELYKN